MIVELPSAARIRRLTGMASIVLCVLASGLAQAFQLQDMNADRVDLTDYVGDGRWTLVMFWSTDCIPCEQQKPMLEAFHREHQASDAHVVGVALDGLEAREAIQQLIERHDPSYPNLVVFTDVFQRQFRELTGKDFRATPTYLLFEPSGTLAGARAGPIDRALIESVIAGG
ncbi:MAG: TlpA family protein disulfide reductase [Granulosicoccus sp.]|nr:TlpA family protein disulfide reductase [Granulosicoccus sp.]